jgi:hypothetical protein
MIKRRIEYDVYKQEFYLEEQNTETKEGVLFVITKKQVEILLKKYFSIFGTFVK